MRLKRDMPAWTTITNCMGPVRLLHHIRSHRWGRLAADEPASLRVQALNGPADIRWEKYFDDPSAWWDNRGKKTNPKAPDFVHKLDRWVTASR